jgi:hypothetical protein
MSVARLEGSRLVPIGALIESDHVVEVHDALLGGPG